MTFMLRGLVDHAIERTPEATANALAEMIHKGENHALSSYSIVLFRGLHVEGRHAFPGGLSVVSFEEAREYMHEAVVPSLLRGNTDAGRQPIGAVISEEKWGPAIVPAGYDMEGNWPDRSETFREDALLLVDLLALTHELPVVSTGWRTSGVEREVEHLVGRVPYFSRTLRGLPGTYAVNVVSRTTPAFSPDRLSECAQLFSHMREDDVILRLALSRVASSLARTGIHMTFDRIIDLAIALEIMYRLDASRRKGRPAISASPFSPWSGPEGSELAPKNR